MHKIISTEKEMTLYSLHKSKKILISVYHLWRRKKNKLLPTQAKEIQNNLQRLQEEILKKNREKASYLAHECTQYARGILKKSSFEQVRDFILSLAFALIFALLIRQMWFELYRIPTGSMRPTLKEKDQLIVSKTNFGINIPFSTKHFYFDPQLVQRSAIIVFTVENMDVRDPNTMYFWIFPGKKQFVKRMMGRPGDTVYFYGGKIYGINAEGKDISSELQRQNLTNIDFIPFIHFDGDVSVSEPFQLPKGNVAYRMAVIHQMNEPIARLTTNGGHRFEGEMLYNARIHHTNFPPVKNYSDLWGIGNYALARIVTKKDLLGFAEKNEISLEEGKYYLELKHHPNLKLLELERDFRGRIRPQFILGTSIIPLEEKHLKAIFANLYTGRFIIKNGYAMRYQLDGRSLATHYLTRFDGVPDGTYEFYYGKGYEIKWQGITKELPSTHPLMQFHPDWMRKLFNYGIDFNRLLASGSHFDTNRFVYFRDENLYVMGAPVFKKEDPLLKSFIEKEWMRKSSANSQNPYEPFIDNGPPLDAEGNIDKEKIQKFGLLIPPQSYLALGDNYAMSGDSREFGFVPQGNLRGSPLFVFWPPESRFGPPPQPSSPWVTIPNIVVVGIASVCFGIWYLFHRRYKTLPLKNL